MCSGVAVFGKHCRECVLFQMLVQPNGINEIHLQLSTEQTHGNTKVYVQIWLDFFCVSTTLLFRLWYVSCLRFCVYNKMLSVCVTLLFSFHASVILYLSVVLDANLDAFGLFAIHTIFTMSITGNLSFV